jgi:hypothetical protein
LAGISGAKLSQYLNDVVRVGAQDELRLRNATIALRKLVEFSRPLPLDFGQVGAIRQCIDMMESGDLQIIIFSKQSDGESDSR